MVAPGARMRPVFNCAQSARSDGSLALACPMLLRRVNKFTDVSVPV